MPNEGAEIHCTSFYFQRLRPAGITRVAAQNSPGNTPAAQPENEGLTELIVTATRQTDNRQHVPLSITSGFPAESRRPGYQGPAKTSSAWPRRGDTQRAGRFRHGSPSGASSPRPVRRPPVLISTTRRYRSASPSAPQNGNGSPMPYLSTSSGSRYCAARRALCMAVPSLGGTIRFITPTPSLTDYSMYTRASVSTTDGGNPSTELGVAGGWPNRQGRTGFPDCRLRERERRVHQSREHLHRPDDQHRHQ